MSTSRKLIKVGNSYAAIIPRSVMSALGIDSETVIEYATDGENLIIRPKRKATKKARVAKAIDTVFTRYRKTMLILAGR